ncbi:MAG: hypothetical protein ACLR83_08210 [Alistipes shahii]
MKNRLLSILFVLLAGTGAVFAQSEVTPPAFNGAVIRVFMTRMAATVEKIAIEQQIPADSISPVVGIVLQIDKAGNVAEWRYMDNTQEGRDHAEFAPATAATRRAMEKAYDRLGGTWSPATLTDGSPVSYTSRMTIRIPVEKIRRAQDADPLLFMGKIRTRISTRGPKCASATTGVSRRRAWREWCTCGSTSSRTGASPSARSCSRPTSG